MRTEFEERCLTFGVGIILLGPEGGLAVLSPKNREQLVSSATSVGANVSEARSAQSRADFISKLEIALKEAREADYWLEVLCRVLGGAAEKPRRWQRECYEITAILVSSVKTAKANLERERQRRGTGKAESSEQN